MRTYPEALDYLNHFINYERQRPPVQAPETLHLDRIRELLGRLGDPHRAFPAIHIAGSKGKGSTAAMIESILRTAGYRTGLYTSPHLHTVRERIRVSGESIRREEFSALIDVIEPHVAAVAGVTWFEIITALAFLHFSRSRIDVGVIEVGLGGRFDATNTITPLVSLITSLSLEHTAWLGDTLDKIAFEKAGIIKPGVPVVSAPQPPEALAVIERVAAERGAPLTVVGREINCTLLASSLDGQRFTINASARHSERSEESFSIETETLRSAHALSVAKRRGRARRDDTFHIPLLGAHQVTNAALAITAIRQARGLAVDDEAARNGLARVHWPGRFEIARRDPPLIFDGAHNADSARKLTATLAEVFPDHRWTLIFGASSDKDIAAMIDALLPCADRVIVTRAKSARAADLESIAQLVADRRRRVEIVARVKDAIDATTHSDEAIVVAGSLYVVAEARAAWFERAGLPLPDQDA